MTAHDYNTTDAIDTLVSDPRFDQDCATSVVDHNTAQVMLFAGYEDEQREIIRGEFGLEITDEQRGAGSGDTVATVVDPEGDEPDSVDVEMDASDAIGMF
jgi:hypothetical protein